MGCDTRWPRPKRRKLPRLGGSAKRTQKGGCALWQDAPKWRLLSVDDHHYSYVDERRSPTPVSVERFDRLEFAMRALRFLRPRMSVAIYTRHRDLRVDRGCDLARPDGAWAIVGIPPHASRQHIALALAELAGVEQVPFAVDLLVAATNDWEPRD
jgi:hypothetical protein